jgi:hypothetical protein
MTDNETTTEIVPVDGATPAYYGGRESIVPEEDLALPQLRIGHSSSLCVQEGDVPFGALYVAYDAADPEPQVLFRPGEKAGVRVHVLGKRSVWCFNDEETDKYTVRDVRESPAPPVPDAQRGYEFAILIPAYDMTLPAVWLVKSSAMACGKRILTTIMRDGGPPSRMCFELTTVARQNERGRWFVPQAVSVKPQPKHIEAAVTAAALLGVPE